MSIVNKTFGTYMMILQFVFVLFTIYSNSKTIDHCRSWNGIDNSHIYRKCGEELNEIRRERDSIRAVDNQYKNKNHNISKPDSVKLHSNITIPSTSLQDSVLVTYPTKDGVLVSKVYTLEIEAFKTIIE